MLDTLFFIMVKVGYLYKVITDNFKDSGKHDDFKNPVEKSIPKGYILEIRYPFEWHFRTNKPYKEGCSNCWGHSCQKEIIENCKLIGQVNSIIQANRSDLSDILENNLFDKYENSEFIRMPESSYMFLFDRELKRIIQNIDVGINKISVDTYLMNGLMDICSSAKYYNFINLLSKYQSLDDKYGTSFCCA